jgi:hypothetical protein
MLYGSRIVMGSPACITVGACRSFSWTRSASPRGTASSWAFCSLISTASSVSTTCTGMPWAMSFSSQSRGALRPGLGRATWCAATGETNSSCSCRGYRIASRVNLPCEFGGKDIRVTAAIGVSMYPEDGRTAAELLEHADELMYRAKASIEDPPHEVPSPARRRDDKPG